MDSMSGAVALMVRGDETRVRIKDFIRTYWAEYGTPPSLKEIATGLGFSSHNAIRSHLLLLQARGEVTWKPGQMRTIRLIDPEPAPAPAKKPAKKAAPKGSSSRRRT